MNCLLAEQEQARLDALQAALAGDGPLEAAFRDGELRLYAGGAPALSRIFLPEAEGVLVETYWRFLLLGRDWRDAKSLANELRNAPAAAQGPAVDQFRDRVERLAAETAASEAAEREMNELLFGLYGLTDPERELVDNAAAR